MTIPLLTWCTCRRLGRLLNGIPREAYYIATKVSSSRRVVV
jgi:hypothetical protein